MARLAFWKKITIGAIIFGSIATVSTALIAYYNTEINHELLVKGTEWCYTIEIQELKQQHEEGWSAPPKDAYDISREQRRHGATKVNGIKIPRYDTWYSYSVDRRVNTRSVVSSGFDKDTYWEDYILKESDDPRNLGSERVGSSYEVYTAFGMDSSSDAGYYIDVSKDIWGVLEPGNIIIYKIRKE